MFVAVALLPPAKEVARRLCFQLCVSVYQFTVGAPPPVRGPGPCFPCTVSWCSILSYTVFGYSTQVNVNMLNDVLCNSRCVTNRYSICVCPSCVLEHGGIKECYTGRVQAPKHVQTCSLYSPYQWRIYIVKLWTRAPPWGSKFFQFHAVFGKFWQNRMLAPLPRGVGAPPRRNPGSATAYCLQASSWHSIEMPSCLVRVVVDLIVQSVFISYYQHY